MMEKEFHGVKTHEYRTSSDLWSVVPHDKLLEIFPESEPQHCLVLDRHKAQKLVNILKEWIDQ